MIESSNELRLGISRLREIGDESGAVVGEGFGGGGVGMDYFYLGKEIKVDVGSDSASDLIRERGGGSVGYGRGEMEVGAKYGRGERRVKKPMKS